MDKDMIRQEWKEGKLLAPTVDIIETSENILLQANMPGVNKDSVEVKFSNGSLTIYGQVMQKISDQVAILKEIEDGNFYRVFKVSDSIETDKIKAKMEDGVLLLTLPKHERAKPREISIEVV